jgi:methylenetetrahydromethanopterin dehydrogenase
MTGEPLKLAVVKFGCIGALPLLDIILDERAVRKDIAVRAWSSGVRLDPESCAPVVADVLAYAPDLVLMVSPAAAQPGPTAARETLSGRGVPTICVSDGAARKAFLGKGENGAPLESLTPEQGFILLPCDSMIGARKEFLDATEMALFNADVLTVLSATGVIRLLHEEFDRVIAELRAGNAPRLPRIEANAEAVIARGRFANPYAAAKATAALVVAESVSRLTTRACFRETDPARYVPQVAAAHELMRAAALLAAEAREIEKRNDSVTRTPHNSDGQTLTRTRLLD